MGCVCVVLGALLLLLALAPATSAGPDALPKGVLDASPYPPSFRAQVAEAIDGGVASLLSAQAEAGHWGDASELHTMGHTSLVLMAALKGGLDPSSDPATRAWTWLRGLERKTTYGVSCYLMAIWARYAPLTDVFEREGSSTSEAVEASSALWARLEEADRDALTQGVAFLLQTQRKNGYWDYDIKADPPDWAYDLSNSLYAVLGLRAAAACGAEVHKETWLAAIDGILTAQEEEGPKAKLVSYKVKGVRAHPSRKSAAARGFRYKLDKQDGPKGPWTAWTHPATGSMTTAGLTALTICRDELARGRHKLRKRKRAVASSLRDGMAWLQEHFTVAANPGQEKVHHFDYLYGLERVCMLSGRRWIGTHDWYREGADLLLGMQKDGGWGDHLRTSFAVLFLKRSTPPPAVTGR